MYLDGCGLKRHKNLLHSGVHDKDLVFVEVFTMEARMGRNRVVVAVLLEHSVKVATSRESRMEMAKGGIFCRGTKLSPSHLDKPDT